MKALTSHGQAVVKAIQDIHGISHDSAYEIACAVQQGNGRRAQFSTTEFGMCQWMRGGMTMVGDMFNNGMRAKVESICSDVSSQLATGTLLEELSKPAGDVNAGA